jgi:hypothetical protein
MGSLVKIKLDPKKVKELFETSKTQEEYVVGLYKMAIPDWDKVEKVNGFPLVNKKTSRKIFSLAIDFDTAHHKQVMAGGMWMNNGFSSLQDPQDQQQIADWEVIYNPGIIRYIKGGHHGSGKTDSTRAMGKGEQR